MSNTTSAKSKWALDTAHSSIDFSIRHMMVSNVKGTFHSYSAEIEADPNDLTTADIKLSVDLDSIDTRNADRDNHLRSGDFFEIEKNPQMTFVASKIVRKSDEEYDLTGDLTLHGVTRLETFSVTFEGSGKDPWGNEKAGFSAKGVINRSDYGLTYNSVLETGGIMIGDQVKISIEIQGSKQA